jgi:hypothetical protein
MSNGQYPKSDGGLWINQNRATENHPHYRGHVKVTADQINKLIEMLNSGIEPELQMAAWSRTAATTGQQYISISAEAYIKPPQQAQQPMQQPQQIQPPIGQQPAPIQQQPVHQTIQPQPAVPVQTAPVQPQPQIPPTMQPAPVQPQPTVPVQQPTNLGDGFAEDDIPF